ncbi:hypothetical protein LTR56_020923 [Elasticomyces elasticus]|nr:hypothetical protein LTR56_020923 [Elasticomyces elasticus]KAK3665225.1 hypothetical protein LTR22_004032 [Elasticomyces elasticus]KAK4909823.1 hypothetical protein LTR49_021421 [Elasticomyces elasticus]KAK5749714.1 hypothetical protein LTS12_020212 [Elasticomyces elasticus]
MAPYYSFGIELEMIVDPHKVRSPLKRALYYEKLAKSLRARGLKAQFDDCTGDYRKHAEQYDKGWWIGRDGSLGDPGHPGIPLEAVSPILTTKGRLGAANGKFLGSTARGIPYAAEVWLLRNIALGVLYFENQIQEMLPAARRNASYCQRNTKNSHWLRSKISRYRRDNWQELRTVVAQADRAQVVSIMQSDRKVLWNFENAGTSGSGTVEFRGGRGMRGPIRTKRWIAFTVAIIEMFLRLDMAGTGRFPSMPTSQALYEDIKRCARDLALRQYLPDGYRILNESPRQHDTKHDEDDDSGSSMFDVSADVYRGLEAMKNAWRRNSYNVEERQESSPFDIGPAASEVTRNVLRKIRRQ